MRKLLLMLAMSASLAAVEPVEMLSVQGVEDLGRVGVMHRFRIVVANGDPQYGLTGIAVRLTWRGATTVLPIKGVVAPRSSGGGVLEVAERDGVGDASVTPAAALFVSLPRSL